MRRPWTTARKMAPRRLPTARSASTSGASTSCMLPRDERAHRQELPRRRQRARQGDAGSPGTGEHWGRLPGLPVYPGSERLHRRAAGRGRQGHPVRRGQGQPHPHRHGREPGAAECQRCLRDPPHSPDTCRRRRDSRTSLPPGVAGKQHAVARAEQHPGPDRDGLKHRAPEEDHRCPGRAGAAEDLPPGAA